MDSEFHRNETFSRPLSGATVEWRTTCNGCGASMVMGTNPRHKCLICDDFDLCSTCISGRPAHTHNRAHAFFLMLSARDVDDYYTARNAHEAVIDAHSQLHIGIKCDGCDRPLVGVRHKCVQCNDFDYCTACLSMPDKRRAHGISHLFLPIPDSSDYNALEFRILRSRNLSEAGILASLNSTAGAPAAAYCDGCALDIRGVRHKCLDCPDYDLCTACLCIPDVRASHDTEHAFFPIRTPSDMGAFTRALAARAPPAYHQNIVCDVCARPIVGELHPCSECPKNEMCSACVGTPGAHARHQIGHKKNV